MDYHVFKKPRLKGGKRIYKWYYYYTQNGKRVQKVCKGCNNRSEAESYIRTLPSIGVADTKLKIKDIAKNMFLTGSDHVSRREQFGLSVSKETMQISRGYILKIIEQWGEYNIDTLAPKEILQYLFKIERSGSWKNSYLSVFNEIFQEAVWYNCTVAKPNFRSFVRHSKKADIFSTEELDTLLKRENFPNEMMYLFFLLCLSPKSKGTKRLPATDGRRLIPHSLRYTYVSRMRRQMSAEDLKNYTGHSSTTMVDYYSRRSLELLLQGLPESGKKAANTLFL